MIPRRLQGLLLGVLAVSCLAGCPPPRTVEIVVTPETAAVTVGDSVKLSAASTDESDSTFEWSSDRLEIAVVTYDGTVTARSPGTARIRAVGTSSRAVGMAEIIVTAAVSEPPTADFDATPRGGVAPLSVAFTDGSAPGTARIIAWRWDFGDGTASYRQNPAHTYSAGGGFTVSLTVTTAVGSHTATKEDYIAVGSLPTAAFGADATSGIVPLTVQFADESGPGTRPIVAWHWDFGDGATSDEPSPAHTYGAVGSYAVSLTVTTAVGTDTATREDYITVEALPTAAFSADATSGIAPFTLQFTDESAPGTAPITAWHWDFGDGATSEAPSPAHTYAVGGSFTVSLMVTTAIGSDTAAKEDYITVEVLPTAAFSADETSGVAPFTVQFTDQSDPGTSPITACSWDFGDGTASAAQHPAHTYPAGGSYSVSLVVTTPVGSATATRADYITVSVLPTAAFRSDVTSGPPPLTVHFTDESLPGTSVVTAWAWDFGDGAASTDQHPTHTYPEGGVYTVSLTVTSEVGSDSETRVGYIAVGETWAKAIGPDDPELMTTVATAVQPTSDGGYAVAGIHGERSGSDLRNPSGALVKVDAQGDVLWRDFYLYPMHAANALTETPEGSLVVAGLYVYLEEEYIQYNHMAVNAIDASGERIWAEWYYSTLEVEDEAWSVQTTPDGGYIIAGDAYPGDVGRNDMRLLKTDADGDRQWHVDFGGEDEDDVDYGNAVRCTTDGGYLVVGSSRPLWFGVYDMFVVKTDASGNEEWRRTYGGSHGEAAKSVQLTADGGYVLAGYTESFGAGAWDMYLVKIDGAGDVLWSQTFGGPGTECAQAVVVASDGGYVLAGYTDSYGAGGYDMWLVKTGPDGALQWSRTMGGESDDAAADVQVTADAGYILAGATTSFGYTNGAMYLVKTNAHGLGPSEPSEPTEP